MIAKISATENLGGALGYNFKKVEKEEASILLAQGLYQNKEGTYTMAEVFVDMEALIPKKCRTKKTVFHCSLNPHPDEKLSDETLTQIAKEYMEALGYGKQPYICSNTTTSPMSIYTSCRFEWTERDERLTTSLRNGGARRLPMPWKRGLVSFQVQRSMTKQ
ncbi:hypothetical protein C7379_1412 [Hallella colorans]|uniref:MobA/VirD2-like nuclease domain-containing protein n=1 Tax=Hallella colorans TaxID=1703337 RepID=A0A2U0TJH3_9BACT|nr:hypothetical protein C7379_1412 [Hallella colorans]